MQVAKFKIFKVLIVFPKRSESLQCKVSPKNSFIHSIMTAYHGSKIQGNPVILRRKFTHSFFWKNHSAHVNAQQNLSLQRCNAIKPFHPFQIHTRWKAYTLDLKSRSMAIRWIEIGLSALPL